MQDHCTSNLNELRSVYGWDFLASAFSCDTSRSDHNPLQNSTRGIVLTRLSLHLFLQLLEEYDSANDHSFFFYQRPRRRGRKGRSKGRPSLLQRGGVHPTISKDDDEFEYDPKAPTARGAKML